MNLQTDKAEAVKNRSKPRRNIHQAHVISFPVFLDFSFLDDPHHVSSKRFVFLSLIFIRFVCLFCL